jgi:hypothetical protein
VAPRLTIGEAARIISRMRAVLLGSALALVAAACAQTHAGERSAGGAAGAGGGGSPNLGGGCNTAGTDPPPTLDLPPAPQDSPLAGYCGGVDFYCETDECIGIVECEGGASGVAKCRCIAELPQANGEGGGGGEGGAARNGALPPAPDPYPGPGCPVSPQPISCGASCSMRDRCDYGDVTLCCGSAGEDCGRGWRRCTCNQIGDQSECVPEL